MKKDGKIKSIKIDEEQILRLEVIGLKGANFRDPPTFARASKLPPSPVSNSHTLDRGSLVPGMDLANVALGVAGKSDVDAAQRDGTIYPGPLSFDDKASVGSPDGLNEMQRGCCEVRCLPPAGGRETLRGLEAPDCLIEDRCDTILVMRSGGMDLDPQAQAEGAGDRWVSWPLLIRGMTTERVVGVLPDTSHEPGLEIAMDRPVGGDGPQKHSRLAAGLQQIVNSLRHHTQVGRALANALLGRREQRCDHCAFLIRGDTFVAPVMAQMLALIGRPPGNLTSCHLSPNTSMTRANGSSTSILHRLSGSLSVLLGGSALHYFLVVIFMNASILSGGLLGFLFIIIIELF